MRDQRIVVVVVSRWNLSWLFVGPSLASLGEAICPPERSRGAVIGLVDSMSVQVQVVIMGCLTHNIICIL